MIEEEKAWIVILSKIAELAKTCPYFGNWDQCNDICQLYDFCDQTYTSMSAERVHNGS